MKKRFAFLLALTLLLSACGGKAASEGEGVELTVFAAASLTETLTELAEQYQTEVPGVKLVFNFDSSGTLQKQLEEGAPCDLFLSAAPRQMDELEAQGLIDSDTRLDLLENKVVLAVAEENPRGIQSFDQLAKLLREEELLVAVGGSDVPVGQYTRKIFSHYGIDEDAVAQKLTYGSNAKEVATQTGEGSVDCGIVYATDARAAGLLTAEEASADLCGRVLYPAAVLKDSRYPEEAAAFLDYLRSDGASAVFEAAGFTPLA